MAKPDWRNEARTLLAAGYGQRESARKLGVPEERLKKWAQREGIAKAINATLVKMSPALSPPERLSPIVPSAASIIQGDAETLGPEARHIAARIGHSALSHVDRVMVADPERGLVQLDSALTAGKLLQTANVPGWERREQVTHTQGDAISEADLERLLSAALAKLPELEAEVKRLDA